jgi:hypothetical protein
MPVINNNRANIVDNPEPNFDDEYWYQTKSNTLNIILFRYARR